MCFFVKMAQQPVAAPPLLNMVVVNGLADLLPDSYSGDMSTDIEEFFRRYRHCLNIHQTRFENNSEKVAAIKYVLSGTALQWFNEILAANIHATVNDLQHDLLAKFRIAKTRQEWKKEIEQCKYVPGNSTLPMINKFQLICRKSQWPLPVQIEKFVRIIPMNLRQFVVCRAHLTFAEVSASVKTYQELIEVDSSLSSSDSQSDQRDYYSNSRNRNGYFRNRSASLRYFNNRYYRPNSGPCQQWQAQSRNQDSYQGNNNNYGTQGYGKYQYNQHGGKGQNRGYRLYDNYPKRNGNNGHLPQSYSGNGQNQHQYSNTNPTSLSNLSSLSPSMV